MSNFSTEFPIDTKNSVASVINLARTWLSGSPHTKFLPNELPELIFNGEQEKVKGVEQFKISHATLTDHEIAGVRYRKIEGDLEWTTSIVTCKYPTSHLLSIQVNCEALNTSSRLPASKKPYFIKQAIEVLGGGQDGAIPVAGKPIFLDEDDSEIAAALINGTADNSLPIIYVSANFKGQPAINPTSLALLVSGMAHVIVEPSRTFSFKVRPLTGSKNSFGGSIGIYWPRGDSKKTYSYSKKTPNARALEIAIAKDIRIALSNRRLLTNCTWHDLQEASTKSRLEALRKNGSQELNDYAALAAQEIEAKDRKISELQYEVSRQNAEISRLSRSSSQNKEGLISLGVEQDLYESEIRDIIIDALKKATNSTTANSRRQHVLNDLLTHNVPCGQAEKVADEIKSLLKNYQSLNQSTRNSLAELGFDITEEGKHYKAIYQNDGRYTFSFSKTPSDHRSGSNLASDIKNKLFM